MNPVSHGATTQQTDPAPSTTSLTVPTRPTQPLPALTSVQAKSAKPALLNLKLNLSKGSGEADCHNAGPGSPSSRSKTKVQRAITEAGGQKRAIDGTDGPGSTSTQPGKRQKMSTPPGSPRGSASPLKQLIKQSRPVTDLKAMAGLSPRRSGTASPPSSPREVARGELATTGSPADALAGSSPTRSVLTESGRLAPRWRSSSHADYPQDSPSASPSRHARSGSLSLDPVGKDRIPDGWTPAAPATQHAQPPSPNRSDLPDENPWEFTFSACDYGQNGELALIRQELPAPEKTLASSGTASPDSQSFASTLIAAELLPKAKAQKDAAAAYVATLRTHAADSANSMAEAVAKGRNALADEFAFQQAGLETDVILVEMALEQNVPGDLADCLSNAATRLAGMKSALAASATHKRDDGGNAATVAAQQVLWASLDAMEVAFRFGAQLLADEPAPRADPVITPSNAALIADLDALDALMDAQILPAATNAVPAIAPRKQ